MRKRKKRIKNRPLRGDVVTHYTYRLSNSLPYAVAIQLGEELERHFAELDDAYPPPHLRSPAQSISYLLAAQDLRERYELRYESYLHQAQHGPMYLADPAAKRVIIDSWLTLEARGEVVVHVISVMSNHVHVVLSHPDPNGISPVLPIFDRHQRFTATHINRLQQQKGRRVWATTVFDRDVRPYRYWQVLAYVLNNPVKAGITDDPLIWEGNYIAPALLSL